MNKSNNKIETIKFKINGTCMNKCRFCIFNNDKRTLSIDDISRVMSTFPEKWDGQILINGGEPTIHKDIIKINQYISNTYSGCRLGLGTNLRLFENSEYKSSSIFSSIISSYDLIQIGCDDEHNNIDIVEELVPVLIEKGLEVYINCIKEYASSKTVKRLQYLDYMWGSFTRISQVLDHQQLHGNVTENTGKLCKNRKKDVLIRNDGEIYFCFKQDFIASNGNIYSYGLDKIKRILFEETIKTPYKSCMICPHYTAEEPI